MRMGAHQLVKVGRGQRDPGSAPARKLGAGPGRRLAALAHHGLDPQHLRRRARMRMQQPKLAQCVRRSTPQRSRRLWRLGAPAPRRRAAMGSANRVSAQQALNLASWASTTQLRRRRTDCRSTAPPHPQQPAQAQEPSGQHLAGRGAQVGARAEPGVAARGARARGAVPVGAGDGGQARALSVHDRRARLAAHHLALRGAAGALRRPGVLPGGGCLSLRVCVAVLVRCGLRLAACWHHARQ
jgi:hypothetical protein